MPYRNFSTTKPIETEHGIKATTKRGAFGQHWWAKRWITALESFHDANRLRRGKAYARKGQVTEIEIGQGMVKAAVQGSRKRPYSVTIEIDTLSPELWKMVAKALSSQALYIAKLTAREMPVDIEEIFNQTNIPLFPSSHNQIHTDCSCPDWSNPCKHVAAVYYLLAEEFDRDPFLIFRLRGIEREAFFHLLEDQTPKVSSTTPHEEQPLSLDLEEFWKGKPREEENPFEDLIPPISHATLPKTLGSFPFWRGQIPFQTFLEEIYSKASKTAHTLLLEDNRSNLD